MSEAAQWIVACIVVGVQLAVPLILGVPILLRGAPDDVPAQTPQSKRRGFLARRKSRGAPTVRDDGPRLAALVCAQCKAPVPLVSSQFPCPFCAAPVAPPPEYVAALRDRERAAKELLRAERLWRWSRVTSSPWLLWPVRLIDVAWSLLVGLCCAAVSGVFWFFPWPVLAAAGIVAFFQVFIGLFYIQVFADMRKTLPPPPKRTDLVCGAETAACRGCTAPMQFAANQLAAVCNYCGADNYRAALARAQREGAAADKDAASRSLLDAARDVRSRRNETVLFIGFLCIAELFYAVVFTLGAAWDAVSSFLGL